MRRSEAIRRASQIDGLVVGAGTVLTEAQLDAARRCGRAVRRRAVDERRRRPRRAERQASSSCPAPRRRPRSTGRAPSAATSSRSSRPPLIGGPAFIKAVSPVFPDVKFIPTGGITAENLADYLALPSVLACGGTWICEPRSPRRPIRRIERAPRRGGAMRHEHPPARGVPLRPRRARRGDAALRPGRRADRDDALVRRLRGRRRVQRRARASTLLRPAHRDRHRLRRQPGRQAARGSDPAGRRRPDLRALDALRRDRPRPCATGSTSSSAASAFAPRSAAPTAAAPPRRSSGRATSTGIASSAGTVRAGSTAAGSSRRSRRAAAEVALEAMTAARRHGAVVSFDLNYRPSLWESSRRDRRSGRDQPPPRRAGRCAARERGGLLRGARLPARRSVDESHTDLDVAAYERLHAEVLADYPNLASWRRRCARRARRRSNDWSGGVQHAGRSSSSGRRCAGSRSSTASAEATRSPPV